MEHELARTEFEHDQCVRRMPCRDQRTMIDMLQVSALLARHCRAGISLAQDRIIVGQGAGAPTRSGCMSAAGGDIQIVDNRADHVRVLDRFRNSMAVVDQETKPKYDERPTRDQ